MPFEVKVVQYQLVYACATHPAAYDWRPRLISNGRTASITACVAAIGPMASAD